MARKRSFIQLDDPAGGKLLAGNTVPLIHPIVPGIPAGLTTDVNAITGTTFAFVCYLPHVAGLLLANATHHLTAVRDHLLEIFPEDGMSHNLVALSELHTAAHNAHFVGLGAGAVRMIIGVLEFSSSVQLARMGVLHGPGPARPRARQILLHQLPHFGASSELRFLRIGPGGRGSHKSLEQVRQWNSDWVRYIHAQSIVLTNLIYETYKVEKGLQIAMAASEETEVDPYRDLDEFDPDVALIDAKQMLYAKAPAAQPTYEDWIQSSGAELYLQNLAPNWFLGKRSSWRQQVRYWHMLAKTGSGGIDSPTLLDFSDHPQSWSWSFYRECIEREPINQRLLIVSAMGIEAGIDEFTRQLSMPEQMAQHGHEYTGFVEARVRSDRGGWYDHLVDLAAKRDRRSVVVVHVDPGEADKKPQQLANDLSHLAQIHKTAFSRGAKEARMTQNVVLVVHPPCEKLLSALCHLELWLAYVRNPNETVTWHFPGLTPSEIPYHGRLGHISCFPPHGPMVVPLRDWQRRSVNAPGLAGLAAPAPAAIQNTLLGLPPNVRAFLENALAEQRVAGYDQAAHERAHLFPRAPVREL